MLKYAVASILLLTSILLGSCIEEKEGPLNPNGDSELALLMRQMYDESLSVKKAMQEGEEKPSFSDHTAILTAEATEPEKAASDLYKVYARHYLQVLEKMESAPTLDEQMMYYSSLVSSCESCHKALCPGPLVRIEKLKLSDN